MTALVLLMFIASWAIVIGVLQIWGAIRLRKENPRRVAARSERLAVSCIGKNPTGLDE
jgi:uncharacterized membrane protein HdeD (DUF308 family)